MSGRRAVFLDRDGTINKEVHYLRDVSQLELLPRSAEAIKKLKELGHLVILVTNQAVIAKGMLTLEGLEEIHGVLREMLAAEGAHFDALYFCPHHPEATVDEFRMECDCRKPSIGMIRKAMADFEIDPQKSFMVGDMTADMALGEKAGLTTILVKTGHAGLDGRHPIHPDFVASDLWEAVSIIERHAE